MSGIFINYRKGEHTGAVEALYHRFVHHFGEDKAFLDMSSIRLGDRYPDALRQHVVACEVLLVVIHPTWLAATDQDGTRLIDRRRDWVREEIEIGLAAGRPVIPVLLGNAKVPSSQELPESIRDLPIRQAHRIRQGYFGTDVDKLISKLERHVAPTWTPPVPLQPRPKCMPVRWLARLTAVLAATLLALPSVMVLIYEDPYDHDLPAGIYLPFSFSVLLMTIPPIAQMLPYLFRARMDRADREIQSWSITRFNRFATPALLLFLLFGAALSATMADNWRFGLSLALGIYAVFFIHLQFSMMRQERQEEKEQASWPQPLPSLRHVRFQADLRRTISHLRVRVDEWREPLSREQRDKLCWVLAQLAQIMERLRALAQRRRWRWLIDDHPWAASAYAVWIAATLGFAVAMLVHGALGGRLKPSVYLALPMFLLVMGISCVGNLELVYRDWRWRQRLLADEIDSTLAELGEQLPQTTATSAVRGEASLDDRWPDHPPPQQPDD